MEDVVSDDSSLLVPSETEGPLPSNPSLIFDEVFISVDGNKVLVYPRALQCASASEGKPGGSSGRFDCTKQSRSEILDVQGSHISVRSVTLEDMVSGNSGLLVPSETEGPLPSNATLICDELYISVAEDTVSISSRVSRDAKVEFLHQRPGDVMRRLALGLKSNPNSAVGELHIEFSKRCYLIGITDADFMSHMVDVIRYSRGLRKLSIQYSPELTGAEVQVLATVLRESSSLCVLEIDHAMKGMADVLLHAFSGEDSHLALLILRGYHIYGLGNVLPNLVKVNISAIQVYIGHPFYQEAVHGGNAYPLHLGEAAVFPWEDIGRALLLVTTLRLFTLDILEWRRISINSESLGDGLKKMWEASQQSPLISFSLTLHTLFHYR
ncbi:hypothetical protein R1sor_016129 [Riccia sorocarpa]|uniref:Uncharacterized protein n=1 Tax=Riccia sorocarpa TaxID=122646 RepID=A0ABD3HE40_9MARC